MARVWQEYGICMGRVWEGYGNGLPPVWLLFGFLFGKDDGRLKGGFSEKGGCFREKCAVIGKMYRLIVFFNPEFLGDTIGLIRPDLAYNPEDA